MSAAGAPQCRHARHSRVFGALATEVYTSCLSPLRPPTFGPKHDARSRNAADRTSLHPGVSAPFTTLRRASGLSPPVHGRLPRCSYRRAPFMGLLAASLPVQNIITIALSSRLLGPDFHQTRRRNPRHWLSTFARLLIQRIAVSLVFCDCYNDRQSMGVLAWSSFARKAITDALMISSAEIIR